MIDKTIHCEAHTKKPSLNLGPEPLTLLVALQGLSVALQGLLMALHKAGGWGGATCVACTQVLEVRCTPRGIEVRCMQAGVGKFVWASSKACWC